MKIRLVLVRPKFSGNVGLVARAAANFGVSDHVVVNPLCDFRSGEALRRAVPPADRILTGMRTSSSLQEVLADCTVAAGFTRRVGKKRKTIDLREFLEVLRNQPGGARVALVFGNEEKGLLHEELNLCTHSVTIPTAELLPSLNLSHAVAVVLSRLYEQRAQGVRFLERDARPARVTELEGLFSHWRQALVEVGMDQGGNPDRFLLRVRELFHRSALLEREVKLLRGFLSKVQVALGAGKRRNKRVVPG